MVKIIVVEKTNKSESDYVAAKAKNIHRQLYPKNHISLKVIEMENTDLTQEQWREFLQERDFDVDNCSVQSCLGNRGSKTVRLMPKKYRKGRGGFPKLYPKEGMP